MHPHVGAVVAHKDRHVAENLNLSLCAILSQGGPLLVEEELNYLFNRNLPSMRIQQFRHCIMLAQSILCGPFIPTHRVMHSPENIEDGVIGQPRNIVLAELLKSRTRLVVCPVKKVRCSLFNQRKLLLRRTVEVRGALVSRQPGNPLTCKPPLVRQALDADQQWISCKGGQSRIR